MALGFFPMSKGVEGADYRVTPSIRLGQGWDSNIFGTSGNEVSDFYASVIPELIFDTASPNLSMQLRAGVEGRWYYDHPEVSSAGYTKYLRLISIDNGWRPTARFSVSPGVFYLETLDSVARSFLVPVDPAVHPPGIATYGLQRSRYFGASIGLLYQATPSVETTGMLYGVESQYPDQPGRIYDTRTVGADVSVRYAYSPTSLVGVYGNGSYEDFHETPTARMFEAGLLAGHQFNPAFRIDGRLGMSFVRQPASAPGNPDLTDSTPSGTVTLGYLDNTFRADLYGNYGYSGLSGAGEVTRQGTVGISLADNVTQGWSWSLGGYYQVSHTVFAVTTVEVKTVNGRGSVRYAPWEWGAFDLTGYATRENSDVPGGDLNRYSIVLGFTVRKTYTAF